MYTFLQANKCAKALLEVVRLIGEEGMEIGQLLLTHCNTGTSS